MSVSSKRSKTPKRSEPTKSSASPAASVARKPPLDRAPAEARQAWEADQAARDALPATALRGRPRPDRVPAIVSTGWQILSHATKPELAARLAVLEAAGELPADPLGSLRTAILAFEYAAGRAATIETSRVAPASAAAAVPHARVVFERLYAGADFYWGEDEPEVRAALDAMKQRAHPMQLARHLGTLERLIRARIDALGPYTGKLKVEDLEAARDLRGQLRPPLDPSVDADQLDHDLERAFARLDRVYGELAAAINYLERHKRDTGGWPGLGKAGARSRKARAKLGGAKPEAKSGKPEAKAGKPEAEAGAPKPEAGKPKAEVGAAAGATEAKAASAVDPSPAPPVAADA